MKLKYYLRGLGIGIVVTAIIMSFTRQPEKLTDAQIKMRALELGMVEESVLADLQKEEDAQKDIPSFEEIVDEGSTSVNEEDVSEKENVEENTPVDEGNQEENSDADEGNQEENFDADGGNEEQNGLENEESSDGSNSAEDSNEEESTVVNEGSSEVGSQSQVVLEEETAETETDAEESFDGEVVENYIIITIEAGNGSEIVSQRLYEAGLINSASDYNKYLVKNGYDRKLKVGHHEIPAGATEEAMAKILCGIR